MIGLRTWDKDGNILVNMTGNYPKIIGFIDIVAQREAVPIPKGPPNATRLSTIKTGEHRYVIPQGCQRFAVATYLGNSLNIVWLRQITDAQGRPLHPMGQSLRDTWDISFEYSDVGFRYTAEFKGLSDSRETTFRVYYGYV